MTISVFPEKSKCLAKKYLFPAVYKLLEHKETGSGFTLLKAINSGIKNVDSSIGIYAGDSMSYNTFALIFDPAIREYHDFPEGKKHRSDISRIELANLDPEKRYIRSTRIRIARNLNNFDFPPHINLLFRRKLEKKVVSALKSLKGNFQGQYYSFKDYNSSKYSGSKKKLCFPKGDRFQDAAGINSDFPECRGVFKSFDKPLMVWVNEEDHLRVISLRLSADIAKVYNDVCMAVDKLSHHFDFAWHDTYGYLTSCPTNIGTSMRAGVHIQLKKLAQKRTILNDLVNSYNLQIRGTKGEKTRVENAVFDISNLQRLGISEYETIQNLHKGLESIIKTEKKL
ncbi:MAG: phosphagen kinase [Deltaproteobacteria bacterium]|nr:phosphagen kinase [Deltaproteobacteria bacterium]